MPNEKPEDARRIKEDETCIEVVGVAEICSVEEQNKIRPRSRLVAS